MPTLRQLRSAGTDRRAVARRGHVPEPPADVAPHEIERSLKHGAVWALASQIAIQVVRFAGVVVLARLLSPDDYGVAAIGVTIGSFSVILGDLGFGMALVQASNASQRWASTAFWAAIGAGALGFGLVAIGAYPASLALGEPEVTALVIAGGLTLLLVAAGSASNALLRRAMRLGVVQAAGVIGSVTAMVCAIVAAATGAGAWALILQQVVLAAVTTVVYVVAARWHPSLAFSRTAFRSLSRFAMPLTGGHVFGVLQPLLSVLLIGGLLGVDELGIWNFSMAIVLIPTSLLAYPLAQVIYSAFARMRDTPERVAEVWLNGSIMLAAVVLPGLFGLIAIAPDLIPLAFGSQWTPAVPVVQILSVWVMCRSLQTWNSSVMDAAGRPHVAMVLNGIVLVATLPIIWLGSSLGIEGVAVAFSLAALIFGELPSFVLTTRQLGLRKLEVLARLRGIALASLATCIAALAVRHALENAGAGSEVRTLISLVAGVLTYVACLMLFARETATGLADTVRSSVSSSLGR